MIKKRREIGKCMKNKNGIHKGRGNVIYYENVMKHEKKYPQEYDEEKKMLSYENVTSKGRKESRNGAITGSIFPLPSLNRS